MGATYAKIYKPRDLDYGCILIQKIIKRSKMPLGGYRGAERWMYTTVIGGFHCIRGVNKSNIKV